VPVKVNQFGVDGLKGALPGLFNESEYLAERPLVTRGGNCRSSAASFSCGGSSLTNGESF